MDLCAILLSWVLALSHYQDIQGCPEIRPASHDWLEQNACHGHRCKVLGWYPGSGDVIYVDDRMDTEEDLFHTSIVLHEIVHWVQKEEGTLRGDCESSARAEREAYAIQREFLTRHGIYHPIGSVLPTLRCDH